MEHDEEQAAVGQEVYSNTFPSQNLLTTLSKEIGAREGGQESLQMQPPVGTYANRTAFEEGSSRVLKVADSKTRAKGIAAEDDPQSQE